MYIRITKVVIQFSFQAEQVKLEDIVVKQEEITEEEFMEQNPLDVVQTQMKKENVEEDDRTNVKEEPEFANCDL